MASRQARDSGGGALASGEQGAFDLPVGDDELLAKDGVVGDKFGLRLPEVPHGEASITGAAK